ncbi:MAG: hypothetical protein Q4C57_00065 [Bacillota bacterium]|nr:hypothetical protein [Lachnospiraceae bacterium]MDO4462923.1 hypothetical protein [Bacillota bacterium]MDY5869134.1 hypothetical protein [Lachnospiraceae bacterium]
MNKKTSEIVRKILFGMAIFSFVITLLEGCVFYQYIENGVFRFLIILRNSIKAFAFETDITLEDMLVDVQENPGVVRAIIGWAYGIACFMAPYCTLAFFYKLITKFLKINLFVARHRKYHHIIIFGYNEEVKALLSDKEYINKNKYKIHIVSEDEALINDEAYLLHNRFRAHNFDFLELSQEQIAYFLKRIEAELVEDVILFEESSTKNFSLYMLFHSDVVKEYFKKNGKKENIKFFCRCEDGGIERILEDYFDSLKEEEKKYGNGELSFDYDLEIINVPELRIRKILQEHPLHSYYLNSEITNMNQWDLHLLIVGFGKLGQQILLQTMNMGVTGSNNQIMIDVVDFEIEKKKSIFTNAFREEYVKPDGDDLVISSEDADGSIRIRFRNMDIRYQQFNLLLKELGEVNPFTYVAICIEDQDTALHCLSKVHKYSSKQTIIGIRMEFDKRMEKYLSDNNKTYRNVFAIEATRDALSLKGLLIDDIDSRAKRFNRSYKTINLIYDNNDEIKGETEEERELRLWREMSLFHRNSSRAQAEHESINELFLKDVTDEMMESWFGKDSELLEFQNGIWRYKTDLDSFVKLQSDTKAYPVISEFSRMEHRRWCYFMASAGWKSIDGNKNVSNLENPCMLPWEDLVKKRPETCVYDLTPLLMKYVAKSKA